MTPRVVTPGGYPLANVPIVIAGAGPFVTDASGEAVVPNAPGTYSAVVFDGASGQAHVYVGLTRPDPTFEVDLELTPRVATLSGKVSGGTPFPAAVTPPFETEFSIYVPAGLGSTNPPLAPATGEYGPSILTWEGPTEPTAILTALQYEVDVDGLPVSFTGLGRRTVPVQFGDTLVGQDVVMDPVATVNLGGDVDLPTDYVNLGLVPFVGAYDSGVVNLPPVPHFGGPYNLVVPDVPGGTISVINTAVSPAGAVTSVFRVGIDPPAAGVDFRCPLATEQVLPVDGATEIGYDTLFQVTSHAPGRVHTITFEAVAAGPTIRLVTTSNVFTLPDLRAWGLGLPPEAEYRWTVRSRGPAPSVDDVVVPGWTLLAVPGTTERFATSDGPRVFRFHAP